MLGLTPTEMTVLVGWMRVLDANAGKSQAGVLTKTPGKLTNDFFVNLLDMSTVWTQGAGGMYDGKGRDDGAQKWTASRVDLIFGSNSQLRAIAEYYACSDSQGAFVSAFVKAWSKVMDNDRFDAKRSAASAGISLNDPPVTALCG